MSNKVRYRVTISKYIWVDQMLTVEQTDQNAKLTAANEVMEEELKNDSSPRLESLVQIDYGVIPTGREIEI